MYGLGCLVLGHGWMRDGLVFIPVNNCIYYMIIDPSLAIYLFVIRLVSHRVLVASTTSSVNSYGMVPLQLNFDGAWSSRRAHSDELLSLDSTFFYFQWVFYYYISPIPST
jgi:hypothetical protein